jgi:multidrug resistance protein MdtO
MAARDRIRRWQAYLRSFYLLQAPLLQFRTFADPNTRTQAFTTLEDQFRADCARSFLRVAQNLEDQLAKRPHDSNPPPTLVIFLDSSPEIQQEHFSERERALLRMTNTLGRLVDRLQSEVASEPLYAV